jgi:hypothetical protein
MPVTTPDVNPKENALEEMFEGLVAKPEGADGIGPTLGMDVAPEAEAEDKAPEENRSFVPADEEVLKGARSH